MLRGLRALALAGLVGSAGLTGCGGSGNRPSANPTSTQLVDVPGGGACVAGLEAVLHKGQISADERRALVATIKLLKRRPALARTGCTSRSPVVAWRFIEATNTNGVAP
jgi:hypothetical protein